VIPVVSSANVGQLAVDILIASLRLERIGVFDSQYFIPVVGAREDGQPGITTPYELYGHPDLALVVIQQRSPVLKSRKDEFIATLLDFIKSSNFRAVLFLSGVDPLHRSDSQMFTSTYHICPVKQLAGTPLHNLSNLPIPLYKSPVRPNLYLEQNVIPQNIPLSEIPFIPGGGLTRRILSSILTRKWQIPVVSLVHFAMEGDNRADAASLASVVAKVLEIEVPHWKQPGSWQGGLFGTPHDQSLYG